MKFSYVLLPFLVLLWTSNFATAQQLQDDFSDGDFTNNPTWTGDASDFIVNGGGQLQVDNFGNSSSSQLSTAAAIQDSTTWEFYVQMDFAPSTSNYTRVYLQSDNVTPTNTTNGYYMRLGNSGSTDALELYRVDNGSATQIWSGTVGAVATNPTVSVRVVRSALGVWSIFADFAGGTTYVLEGTVSDATYTTGDYFGVATQYTTQRGDKFFFDNILVSPLFVDVIAPTINSVDAISDTEVDVYFDEVLDLTTANNAANYTLDNGATVSAAIIDAVDLSLVHLTTSTLVSTTTYQLTANGVEDISGNATSNEQGSFTYVKIEAATFQDIIFNEIFADPTPQVGLPNAEFVEILNRSNKFIQLDQLVINDGSDKILPSYMLAPDSVVTIVANSNVATYSTFGSTIGISSLSLSNSGEQLTIKNNGVTIDSVEYTLAWYQDAVKDDGGWSLELINPNLLCIGSANWIASNAVAGGTPSQQNSVYNNTPDTQAPTVLAADYVDSNTIMIVFDEALDATTASIATNYAVSNGIAVSSATFLAPDTVRLRLASNMTNSTNYTVTATNVTDCSGNSATTNNSGSFQFFFIQLATLDELIITEVMADPTPQVGLPDAEYIELYNNSNKTLNLADYILNDGSNRVFDKILLFPNEYIVVVPAVVAASFNGVGKVAAVAGLNLSNSGESLTIVDPNGNLVHELTYSSDWYQDAAKDDGGWSLELINPNLLCKLGTNWTASMASFGGTPAQPNSVLNNIPDVTAPKVSLIYQFSATQIYIKFDDVMNTAIGNVANYGINNGATITSVAQISENIIILNLLSPMVGNTTYTITLNNAIEDCVGNSIGVNSVNLTYYETQAAEHYDILINEIMSDPNPPVGLPEKEYVELYNRSNKVINLQNFVFSDGSTISALLPTYIMQPNSYLVIYGNSDTISLSSFGNALAVSGFPDLNTSDNLVLINNTGDVVDAVSYELDWYQNANKDDGGWSLERANPNRPCEGRTNWRASTNLIGGTPAQVNSIFENSADDQAPDALRAFAFEPTRVRVYFSEAIDDQAAATLTNYSIDNGISVVGAMLEAPLYNSVILTLDQAITIGTTYNLTLSAGFTDCVGNPIALKNTARFALAAPVVRGDLILNEILFNPVTSGSDFIELYNNSNKVLNAADLVISNAKIIDGNLANANSLQTNPVLADLLIFPGEYVVITEGVNQVKDQYQTPNPDNFVENNLPTFDDKEGSVYLYAAYDSAYVDAFGNPQTAYLAKVLDLFDYTQDYHTSLIDDENGVSLERIDFNAPTNDGNNWHSAASTVGYATPAYQNSSFRINEIMGDDLIVLPSETVSPDDDGYEDFLLINYNVDNLGYVANIDIYDANGRLIKNLVNGELLMTEGSLQWDGTDNQGRKARIGIHILSITLFNENGDTKQYRKTCVVAGKL